MIDPAPEREAADLLAAKTLSNRKIACRARVSRGTVDAMASGRRPMDLSARCREARLQSGDRDEVGPGEEGRCGECGGLVMLPCRGCRVRAQLKKARRRPGPWGPDEPLTIAMKDEDLAQYEMMRAHKVAELQGEMLAPDAPEELEPGEPTEAELREIDSQEDEP